MWPEAGVASTTASILGSYSTASKLSAIFSKCCLAKASTSGFTVRVCTVVKRMASLPPASDSTMVLPQVPSPTPAALIIDSLQQPVLLFEHDLVRKPVPTPDQVRRRLFRDHAPNYAGVIMPTTAQAIAQNRQYSKPPMFHSH